MSKIRTNPLFDQMARGLEMLCRQLPETLSLDDMRNHPDLRRIALAADDIANRIDRRGLEWCKMRGAGE